MTARKRRRLPPYVVRHGSNYRGWWTEGSGTKRYTKVFEDPQQAHQEAVRRRELRRARARNGRLSLQQGIDLVRDKAQNQERREGTMRYLEGNFAIILAHWAGESPLDEFTVDDVNWFIRVRRDEDQVGANTVRHNLTVLSRIFNVARLPNPVQGADRPQVEDTRIDVFEWEDALDIADTIEEAGHQEDADILRITLYTGLRRSELGRLELPSTSEFLTVSGKTAGRQLPCPPQLADLVQRVKDAHSGDLVVAGDTEDRRCERVRRVFARWGKRMGEPRLHPHAMRHTFASELARRGVPEHIIADLLGHKRRRSSITSRYISAVGPAYMQAMALLWNGEEWHG